MPDINQIRKSPDAPQVSPSLNLLTLQELIQRIAAAQLREFQEAASKPYKEAVAAWVAAFAPGTFLGDVTTVRKGPESEVEGALQRLAAKYFTRRDLFYPERWHALEEAYREYEETHPDAWQHLVTSALFLVCRRGVPSPLALDYQMLRNEVRQEIERALLDGETLRQHLARRGRRQPLESDTPEALDKEAEVMAELVRGMLAFTGYGLEEAPTPEGEVIRAQSEADRRRLLDSLLERCTPAQRRLVDTLLLLDDISLVRAAEQLGISPGTARAQWHNIRQKVRPE